jgi:hypothetical protein
MERLIEQERFERARDPEHEAEVWAQKIAECDHKRSAYQDQQAAGLMTLEELGVKLSELDNTRRAPERELATLSGCRQRVMELEQDRDALLESMAGMVPEALDALTGEEKNRIYRMLRLEVTPTTEGYDVSGALCTSAISTGERPRAASPVTVVGKVASGIEDRRRVSSGERLRVEAAGER